MIDPDGIIITDTKANGTIKMGLIPECDFEPYDLDDEKSFKAYIQDLEREVRGSIEYKQFINYLRNNMNMNSCAYIAGATSTDTYKIRIEIHHYPFTLFDICNIVYNKRQYYGEPLDLEMVAKEVMELHYKSMVGLIPLSETVHKLVHNSKLFIPVDNVFGRYDLFMELYNPFISAEMKDMINRIEKYSLEQRSNLLNTTILDANNLTFDIKDEKYQIPNMNAVTDEMVDQIKAIKDNMYTLPTVHDKPMIEDKEERRPIIKPVYIIE